MVSYRIEFASNVRKDFRKIPENDAKQILHKIDALANQPRPLGAKKLKGAELCRIRIGVYRVIYEIEDDRLIVFVISVKHRREAYRDRN